MLAMIRSGALLGIDVFPVQVETNTGESGEMKLVVVGLPDVSVRESRDRVFSAMVNSKFSIPSTRTTVNLAPGDIRKEGPCYDLPIALGLIQSTKQLNLILTNDFIIAGELGLSGEIRPIKSAISFGLLARKEKRKILLPMKSAKEAALIDDVEVFGVDNLRDAAEFLAGKKNIPRINQSECLITSNRAGNYEGDFSEIKGQKTLKRAIEVAVAGRHNLLMVGPPGVGKSMIAKRIPSIMPAPHFEEFLEFMNIHSAAGMPTQFRHLERPFRAPHHTISDAGLIGGGTIPTPGEISLAHHGVLFLDELPEFKRSALEVLRQPLEDGKVTISRSNGKLTFPCSFMLVAAMNPCPCGYLGSQQKKCRCSVPEIQRYRSKISGPLLDRIDLHVDVAHLSIEHIQKLEPGETSKEISLRINKTQEIQKNRSKSPIFVPNSKISDKDLNNFCKLGQKEIKLLENAMKQLSLSARAYVKILKVARTIADLDFQETICEKHILEAIQYRFLDRSIA